MERLLDRPVWSLSGGEKLSALDTLQADLNRLQTLRLELLAALDADAYATELGARSTADLIAIRHRLDPTDVRRDLRLAQALRRYPLVDTALHATPDRDPRPTDARADATAGADAGDARPAEDEPGAEPADSRAGSGVGVNLGQAAVIVGELEKVRALPRVSPEDQRVAEEVLVEAAGVLSPGDLRVLGRQVRERLDTDGPEPDDEERVYGREKLWLKRQGGGVQFGGYLAGENAELLQTLTFAGAKPHKTADGEADPRPRAQRQADALSGVLEAAASTGTAAPGHGGIKPHITVTIDWAALLSATGTGTDSGAGSGIGAGSGVGVLAHGGTLSAAAIRRLACDAGIIPLVLGSDSEPLDVGMEQRFVTPAIRHALNARDRGCIVCHAPAAMCDAHHVIHWIDGGPTAIGNLVLVCKAHHREIHHGHWTITFANGHPVLTRPTWAIPATPTQAAGHSHGQASPPAAPAATRSNRQAPPTGRATHTGVPGTRSGATSQSDTPAPQPDGQAPSTDLPDRPTASPPERARPTGSPAANGSEPNRSAEPRAEADGPAARSAPPCAGTNGTAVRSPERGAVLDEARAWAGESRAETDDPGTWGSESRAEADGAGTWGSEFRAEADGPAVRSSKSGVGLDDARAWAAEFRAEADGLSVWGSESGPGADGLGVWGSEPAGSVGRPVGGVVHPLADRLSRWLRQGKADYPDPWADNAPEPPEVTPRADSPPAPAAAE